MVVALFERQVDGGTPGPLGWSNMHLQVYFSKKPKAQAHTVPVSHIWALHHTLCLFKSDKASGAVPVKAALALLQTSPQSLAVFPMDESFSEA